MVRADKLAEAGRQNLVAGRYPEALAQFEEVLRMKPNHPWGWHGRALALMQMGRIAEAIEAFKRAVPLNSDDPTVWYNLGHAFVLAERWSDAEPALNRALVENPQYAKATAEMALVAYSQGRLDYAITMGRRALQLNPREPGAAEYAAWALLKKRSYKEALDMFNQEASLGPQGASWYKGAATCYAALEGHGSALLAIEEAVRQEPGNADYVAFAAGALLKLRRFEESRAALDIAMRLDPKNERALGVMRSLQAASGAPGQAVTPLEAVDGQGRAQADQMIQRAMEYGTAKRFEDAIRIIDEARRQWPRDVAVLEGRELVFRIAHRWEDCIAAGLELIKVGGPTAERWYNIAYPLWFVKRVPEAIDSLKQCISLDPSHFDALWNLALYLEEQGLNAEALQALDRALALQPGDKRLANYRLLLAAKPARGEPIEAERTEWVVG